MEGTYYITIGRQFGSGGREVGKRVAQALGIPYYDKELLAVAAKESGLSHQFLESYDEKPTNSFFYSLVMGQQNLLSGAHGVTVEQLAAKAQREAVLSVAEKGSCVIVGRCADYILRDDPRRLSVFVHAPLDERVRRAREEYGVQEPNLEAYVLRQDRARASYYNYFATGKWGQSREYDLCVSSHMGIAAAVATIKAAALAVAGGTGA